MLERTGTWFLHLSSLAERVAVKEKKKHRRLLVILVPAFFVAIGYYSAAVSLQQCDAEIASWLSKDIAAGATPMRQFADRASLSFPFVVTVSYEKHLRLAPQHYQTEWGTRYYFVLFGRILPLGVTNRTSEHTAD